MKTYLNMYHGVEDLLTMISSVGNCCNAGTLLPTEMAYLQHISWMNILFKTLYHHTIDLLLKNSNLELKQENSKHTTSHCPLKHTKTNMHPLFQTFKLDLMLLFIT